MHLCVFLFCLPALLLSPPLKFIVHFAQDFQLLTYDFSPKTTLNKVVMCNLCHQQQSVFRWSVSKSEHPILKRPPTWLFPHILSPSVNLSPHECKADMQQIGIVISLFI